MKSEYYLNIARKASNKSNHKKYHLGCVIVKGSRILGIGWNIHRTHPKSPHQYKFIHAEFMAALNANEQIKGSTVYVFRQKKNGKWAMARPCKDCMKYLINLEVKRIIYSFNGYFNEEDLKQLI